MPADKDNKNSKNAKRGSRRKQRQSLMLIVCIVIIIVVACGVRVLIGLIAENKDGPRDAAGNPASGIDAGRADSDSGSDFSQSDDGTAAEPESAPALWYFEEARAARYQAFALARPELSEEEVCWMVDCDLDLEPYEDTHEIADPNDILLLVNKHFYLPDGYAPDDLISVGGTSMRREAGEAMQEMIDAAAADGKNIWSQSGYRSYGTQVQLFNNYSARDGEEAADTYSARAGYSEHQTGLTTDLNTITDAFGDTEEGKWVAENCWQYGYIVRYTKENTDITLYRPEPWHMRYIGRDAAKIMHDEGILSFEEYWVKYVKHARSVG